MKRKKEGEPKEKKKDKHGTGCGQERQAGPQRPLHESSVVPFCLAFICIRMKKEMATHSSSLAWRMVRGA